MDQVTITELRLRRRALEQLRKARSALEAIDGNVPEDMQARENELEAQRVLVFVPCLLCKQEFSIPVRVADEQEAEPTRCICEACDERTTRGTL